MLFFRSHHHLHLPFLEGSKDFFWIFISKALRSLSESSAFFYLPIFLFYTGNDTSVPFLRELSPFQSGFIFLGSFLFLWRLVSLLSSFKVASLVRKIGLRNAMIIGNFSYMVAFLALLGTQFHMLFFVISAILFGISTPLYWTSYLSFFALRMKKRKSGQEVTGLIFFSKVLNALLPMIAGGLFAIQGYQSVILLSTVFFLLSSLPLLKTENLKVHDKISFTEFKQWLSESRFRKLCLAFVGRNITDIVMYLWPLYLLLIVGSVEKVGYLYSVVLFISLIITYFSGWYIDHKKSKIPFYLSGFVRSGLLIARGFVSTIWGFITVDIFEQLATSIYVPFFDTTYMKRSKGREALSFYTYREIINSISYMVVWLLVITIFLISANWLILFVTGSLGVIISLLLDDGRQKQ